MSDGRPKIPEAIKREVRQRDGFGCIFCGNMLIQYEHIRPYAIVRCHEAANITLLCPNCHQEVTSGRRGKDQVRAAQAKPFCHQGRNDPRYRFSLRPSQRFLLGNSLYELQDADYGHCDIVALSDRSFLGISFYEGLPLFTASLLGSNSQIAMEIVDNEIVVRREHLWDASLIGRTFVARVGHRQKLVEINFDDEGVRISHLKMLAETHAVRITEVDTSILTGGGEATGQYACCRFSMQTGEKGANSFIAVDSIRKRAVIRLPGNGLLDIKRAWKWMFMH